MEVAAQRPSRNGLRRVLELGDADSEYLVRLTAAAALRQAGLPVPRKPEPAESGRTMSDYASVLQWARREHRALIYTAAGMIDVRLFGEQAPLTCWNFARLARDHFFDRGHWHRVVPDFVLQDGCPRGDGYGGSPENIRDEINRERFLPGTLGMALSGKDTGSSQFFLTHSDQPHLDGRYTVFGRIERGQPVADEVSQGAGIDSIRVVEGRR